MDEENIDDLVEAIRKNTPKADRALKILLDRFRGMVFGLYSRLHRYRLPMSDFDTLYHSTAADAILTFDKARRGFEVWLRCNFVYACRAESRQRMRQGRIADEDNLQETIRDPKSIEPIDRVGDDEELARVRRALEKEKEPCRSFLRAWAFGAPPLEEVAAAFGTTKENVRQIRHRNIVNMRRSFTD